LITPTILGEEYWSLSSSLCRSLHSSFPPDLNFYSLHITSNAFVVCVGETGQHYLFCLNVLSTDAVNCWNDVLQVEWCRLWKV
jgi:hypothetical protein